MLRLLKANLNYFMGTRYERFFKTCVVWFILFFALQASEFRMTISPSVLWVTTFFLTVGGFVQVLSSDTTIENIRGQVMLPDKPLRVHTAIFCAVSAYIVITNLGFVVVAYLALSEIQAIALLGLALLFLVSGLITYHYAFRFEKKVTQSHGAKRIHPSFTFYIVRYLLNNRRYLINTVALWVFGSLFSVFVVQNVSGDFIPVGFALMCLNTPLGILLSSDRDLYHQLRMLPGQMAELMLPYALFLTTINILACGILLTVLGLTIGSFSSIMFLYAIVFSFVSAGCTVLLEIKFPLLHWTVESDLWHHPRKYLVPIAMLLLALILVFLQGGK